MFNMTFALISSLINQHFVEMLCRKKDAPTEHLYDKIEVLNITTKQLAHAHVRLDHTPPQFVWQFLPN